MNEPNSSSVRVDERDGKVAKVVIEVPLDDGDAEDHVVFSKAWAILAERITLEKREEPAAKDAVIQEPADSAAPAAPGNAAWWGG